MSLTINITYRGEGDNARRFAQEMTERGVVNRIRAEEGNLRYAYYAPLDEPEAILLIDAWRDQAALDAHHASPMMQEIAALRDKYDLSMEVHRYRDAEDAPQDARFIRS